MRTAVVHRCYWYRSSNVITRVKHSTSGAGHRQSSPIQRHHPQISKNKYERYSKQRERTDLSFSGVLQFTLNNFTF